MNLRLRHVWNAVRSSFWFVPACMVLGAVLLASLAAALVGSIVFLNRLWAMLEHFP